MGSLAKDRGQEETPEEKATRVKAIKKEI